MGFKGGGEGTLMALWSVDARLEGRDASVAHRKEKGRGLYEILVVSPQSKEFIEWGVSSYKLEGLENLSLLRLWRSWFCGSRNWEQLKSRLSLSVTAVAAGLTCTCPLHSP